MNIHGIPNNIHYYLFVKESITLSDKYKKIIMIASIAINFFLIGYVLYKMKCCFKATDETDKSPLEDQNKTNPVKRIHNPIKPKDDPRVSPVEKHHKNPMDHLVDDPDLNLTTPKTKVIDPVSLRKSNIEDTISQFDEGEELDEELPLSEIQEVKMALIRKFKECCQRQLDPNAVTSVGQRLVYFPISSDGAFQFTSCSDGYIFRFKVEGQIYHVSIDGHSIFFPELSDKWDVLESI